jgi:TPR repeat protein
LDQLDGKRNMARGTSLLLVFLLAAATRAFADDFDSGVDAHRRGDYAQALAWYRKAADQGKVTAQNELGRMYDLGIGVAKDSGRAAEWYRKSAENGSAAGQFNLGVLYMVGCGVAQDCSQAAREN